MRACLPTEPCSQSAVNLQKRRTVNRESCKSQVSSRRHSSLKSNMKNEHFEGISSLRNPPMYELKRVQMQCVDEGEGITLQGWTKPSLALYGMLVGLQVPSG
jgi:hypothetical protein